MRVGEIVKSTSTQFVSESFDMKRPPTLGSLVKVCLDENQDLYGVVCYGETGSIDSGRRAVRRSTEDVYDENIYRENPQLKHVLRTEFTSLSVGVMGGERVLQGVPSQPPPLHYSVHSCEPEETTRFTNELHYFRLLLDSSLPVAAEQVLASHVQEMYEQRESDEDWLRRAARETAHLLEQDYDRLIAVLYAIQRGSGFRDEEG